MWWYYKCVNLIKVNTGIKSYSFLHRKCLARKPWTWVELRPIRTIWFDQPPVGGVQTGQLKRWRASGAISLLFPLATLGRSWTRRAQTRARLTWKPARWTLSTKPTIGGGLRPCQSRNGATKSTIVRRAFPMTSRSHLKSPHENNRRSRAEHVTPETKNWTHAGKRNNSENALNPSKQVQTEFLILTKPLKFDLNAVTKQKICSWSFSWLVKLWNRKNIILSPTVTFKTFVCLCVCMSMSYQLIHLC